MKILLIIPAYNEEENIVEVCDTIKKHNKDLEFIVINDGSKDNTLKLLRDNNLKHINLIHNLGIGGAVQTGYKYAYENGYDIAIQFDGDGQHDVNYIEKLCKPILEKKQDFVIGSRYLDNETSEFKSTRLRRFGKNIISFLIKIFWNKKITDPTSGFRAGNRKVIKIFSEEYPDDYPEPESTVKILKLGYSIKEVPVNMKERTKGKSFVNPKTSILYMLKVSLAIIIESIFVRKEKK